MPFKSQAQRRWMYAAESRGEVPKGTAERWQEHTPNGAKLPDHVSTKSAAFIYGYKLAAVAGPAPSMNSISSMNAVAPALKPPPAMRPAMPPTPDKPITFGTGSKVNAKMPALPGSESRSAFNSTMGAKAVDSTASLDSGASMPR